MPSLPNVRSLPNVPRLPNLRSVCNHRIFVLVRTNIRTNIQADAPYTYPYVVRLLQRARPCRRDVGCGRLPTSLLHPRK